MKRFFCLTIAVLFCFCGFSCQIAPPFTVSEKTFEKNGMKITVTDEFREMAEEGFFFAAAKEDLSFFLLSSPFSLYENTDFSAETSLSQWALLFLEKEPGDQEAIQTKDSLCFADKTQEKNGSRFSHRLFFFKGSDAFWILDFSAAEENFARLETEIFSYASTLQIP